MTLILLNLRYLLYSIFSEYIAIQSARYPDHYLGTDNGTDACLLTTPYRLIPVSPGLNGENGTVSFQSLEEPSKYLVNDGNTLTFKSKDDIIGSDSFDDAATFTELADKFLNDTVAFQSVLSPGNFIRYDNGEFILEPEEDSLAFKEDASFNVLQSEDILGKKYFYR